LQESSWLSIPSYLEEDWWLILMDDATIERILKAQEKQLVRHTITFTLSVDHMVEVTKFVQKLQMEEMNQK